MLPKRHGGWPYSPRDLPPRYKTRSLWDTWGRSPNPYKDWGNLHNSIGGSQKLPLRHHKAWEDLHNLTGGPQEITTEASQSLGRSPQLNWSPPKKSIKPLNRLGFQEPKSNKLNELSPSMDLRGELKPCNRCNGKNTSAQVFHTQIIQKKLMLWREEEQWRKSTNKSKI
jgi:hypothetical protein